MVAKMENLDAAFMGASDPAMVGREVLNMVEGSQKFLKKSVNAILPVMLLVFGLGTVIYRHTTYQGFDVVKPFLVMVVVQLLPMMALKLKTWLCSDLASLMPAALIKTLMMHVAVQIFRLTYHTYMYVQGLPLETTQLSFDIVSLMVELYILFKEFGFSLGSLATKEHSDVFTTIASGCIMAVIVGIVAPLDGRSPKLIWILNDVANYMEVLAFVPVARILCLEIGVDEQSSGTSVVEFNRQKIKVFMAFILAFYFWDDICFAVSVSDLPLVAAGKTVHFVMLLDFAGYFILQVGAQPKIVDEILPKVLPEAILQEVMPQQDPNMGSYTEEKHGLLSAQLDSDIEQQGFLGCEEDDVGF